ncbi:MULTISPECIES: YrpD family protein [Paenibacillus]|nr:YrpD family protein [Paenibacillus peoriae]
MGNHSLTPMDFSTNSASFPECRDLRNGPYRSVWSHIGFAWASTRVHLPSAREIRDNNSGYNGSTGFIYMGGWSNTNMAVDVGLQHSTKYNDWAPFMLIEGVKNPYTFKPRFEPDQEVQMKFYVPSDGNIALTVTGYADGEKISRSYVEPAPGWTANGNGNLIKRTTSIGQIQDRQDYNDGSYIRRVRWATSYIGSNSEDNIPWRNSQTYDYCSMPRSKVEVDYVHGGEETDSIFLD